MYTRAAEYAHLHVICTHTYTLRGVKTDSHVYIVHTSSRICTKYMLYARTHGVKTDSHVYIVHTSSRICTNICYMHTHIHTLRERERD